MAKKLPRNVMKRGKMYYVRIRVDGRDVWRSAGSDLKSAQMVLGLLRKEAEAGTLGLPRSQRLTVHQWIPSFMKWSKANKRSWWRDEYATKRLDKFFGDLKLQDVTKQRAEAYARDREKEVKAATVNRELSLMRRILSYAVEQGKLDVNPLLGIKMKPEGALRQPVLDDDGEQRLLAACNRDWFHFMIRLALTTGCRQGELLELRWKHVDFRDGALIIADSKSGESRRVPLPSPILDELRTKRGMREGWVVFVPQTGKPPNRHTVRHMFKRAAKKAELDDLRFHDLRHVAATRLLAAGATLPEVQTYLGHKTLVMARRYAHTSWNRLQSLVANMNGEGG